MKKIRTHYDNLKVARNAPPEVIRAAYKTLSQKHHPDRHGNSAKSQQVMKIINKSYSVLIDPEERKKHDEWIRQQESEELLEKERKKHDEWIRQQEFQQEFEEEKRKKHHDDWIRQQEFEKREKERKKHDAWIRQQESEKWEEIKKRHDAKFKETKKEHDAGIRQQESEKWEEDIKEFDKELDDGSMGMALDLISFVFLILFPFLCLMEILFPKINSDEYLLDLLDQTPEIIGVPVVLMVLYIVYVLWVLFEDLLLSLVDPTPGLKWVLRMVIRVTTCIMIVIAC